MIFSIAGAKLKYDTHKSVQSIIDKITLHITEIIEINFSDNVFLSPAATPLFQTIKKCKGLKKLNISRIFSGLPKADMMKAFEAVIINLDAKSLLYLDISENAISCNLPLFFKKFMIELNSLKVLKMRNCGLGTIGGNEIADILRQIENKDNLMIVDISSNKLIKSAVELGKSLAEFKHLEEVYIQYNNIDRDSMYKFLVSLEDLSLVKLDLRDNLIDERGCRLLGNYFVCWDLVYLRIGDCLIKDEGLNAFTSNVYVRSKYLTMHGGFKKNQCTLLDISYNEISEKGLESLIKFVKMFKIKKIHVEGNYVDNCDKLTETVNEYGGELVLEEIDIDDEDEMDLIEEKIANL